MTTIAMRTTTLKKTAAVIGSAAALSFAGAGLAAAQDADTQSPATQAGTTLETLDENDEGATGTDEGAGAEGTDDEVDTPAEVSAIAQQLCGAVEAYDFLGSTAGVAPGLSGEECQANADAAVAAALTGDIGGAIEILRGIDAQVPGDGDQPGDDAATSGSADLLGGLGLDGLDSLSGDPAGEDEQGDAGEGDLDPTAVERDAAPTA